MTKEEFVAKVIENRREGKTPICYDVLCRECPYKANVKCDWEELRDDLLDYIIDIGDLLHEKQKETNLEHYYKYRTFVHCREGDDFYRELDVRIGKEGLEAFESSGLDDIRKWLLSPYEPPKPKYKLTKFEYDLLNVQGTRWYYLKSLGVFERLIAKGYYKDIPTDITIGDILDNAEVIDGD